MHEETLEFGVELAPLLEQGLLAMYHAHQEHTWVENLIGEIEDALDRSGLRTRLIEPPAICFLDITGYTRLTEERGDRAAAELAARLTPLVQRSAERHDGKVVKWLGDGVMFHFREPTGAVLAALEMVDTIPARPAARALGLHTGPVVRGRRLFRSDRQPRGEDRRARGAWPGTRDARDRGSRGGGRTRLRAGRRGRAEGRGPAGPPPHRLAMTGRRYSAAEVARGRPP